LVINRNGHKRVCSRLLFMGLLVCMPVFAQTREDEGMPILDYNTRFHPVHGHNGMVCSQEALATQIGLDILKKGGNAVDAAVAVGFALAVTLPKAGNLGGGGFMLVHLAAGGKTVAVNFREMAPAAAHRDMYLAETGEVDTNKARHSYAAVGVPGTVAGLAHVLQKYGTLPLHEAIKPAVRMAETGISVSYGLSADLHSSRDRLTRSEATRKIFTKADGTEYRPGDRLVQKDLAWSLKQIAHHGSDAFYRGKIAERLVAAMAQNEGLITAEDLKNYKVTEHAPVTGSYRGYQVVSMPPPSSGGVHIVQMLNILESYPLKEWGHNSAAYVHVLAETMKLAYADRSKYLGDPAFVSVPVEGLISKGYAASLRKNISLTGARPSKEIGPADPLPFESMETTHYSIVDRWGNAVSVTYTLNFSFGTGLVAEGTGILLNNEMDDFSSKPGAPNAFGLLGGEANAIAAGKRPLSSMSPTMVFEDGKPFLVTGSPGGSHIITAVLQTILNVIDFDMNIASASSASRIHHQWYPDQLRVEEGFSVDSARLLRSMGHDVVYKLSMGSTQSIMIVDGDLFGASDPRRPDALSLGY